MNNQHHRISMTTTYNDVFTHVRFPFFNPSLSDWLMEHDVLISFDWIPLSEAVEDYERMVRVSVIRVKRSSNSIGFFEQIPQIEVIKNSLCFCFAFKFQKFSSNVDNVCTLLVICRLFLYYALVYLCAPPPSTGGQQEAYIFSIGSVRYKPSLAITCGKFAFLEMALC